MVLNIYIDSDVMVASELPKEANHSKSKEFMKFVTENEDKSIIFWTSIFTFLELASAMIRRTESEDKAYSLLYRVTNSWKNSINPLPPIRKKTSFKNLIDALIETAIKFRMNSGDCIHAHTIAENKIDYAVTWNVKHFACLEGKINHLQVVTPTNFLEKIRQLKKTKGSETELGKMLIELVLKSKKPTES